jgi:hypothetical protein
MIGKAVGKAPEIILREGKPRAVILNIGDCQQMLEGLEDTGDLRELDLLSRVLVGYLVWLKNR